MIRLRISTAPHATRGPSPHRPRDIDHAGLPFWGSCGQRLRLWAADAEQVVGAADQFARPRPRHLDLWIGRALMCRIGRLPPVTIHGGISRIGRGWGHREHRLGLSPLERGPHFTQHAIDGIVLLREQPLTVGPDDHGIIEPLGHLVVLPPLILLTEGAAGGTGSRRTAPCSRAAVRRARTVRSTPRLSATAPGGIGGGTSWLDTFSKVANSDAKDPVRQGFHRSQGMCARNTGFGGDGAEYGFTA